MIKQLLREAYKQGYGNGHYDGEEGEWNGHDTDFDDWIYEIWADGFVGDIEIPEELKGE